MWAVTLNADALYPIGVSLDEIVRFEVRSIKSTLTA